ncbi:MAG: hypothetical protein R3F14_47910 [Polyangiaceae bacterium]
MGRLTIKTSRTILGKGSEQKLEHDFRPPRHVFSYVHQDRHTEDLCRAVQARAEGGERVFFGSCSRTRIDEIDAQISAMGLGLRVLKITQRTAGLPEVKAFLADPSLATQYDIILASPTLGTGVSIDSAPFAVFFDALAGAGSIATDVIQALCRVRNPVDDTWRVHVRGHAPWSEKDPQRIRENMLKVGKETASALSRITTWAPGFTAEGERCLSPDNGALVDLCSHVRSVEAVGADLEKVLPLLWKSYGYTVDIIEDEPEDKEGQKQAKLAAKESLHQEDVDRVLAAPVLSEEDAQDLETSAQTPEAEAALRAHRIRDLYGIEEVTRDLVEVYDNGRHTRIVHRFVDVLNWQVGRRHAVLIKDHNSLARTGGATLPEVRGYALQADLEAKLWALLGVENVLEDAAKGTTLKTFSALPRTAVEKIKSILGWNVDKLTSNQIAGQLARRCGIKLKSERVTVDGKRKRVYRLDLESVEKMRALSQAQIDRSRRVEKEEVFPGSEGIDLEEIRLLMIKEFAA